MPGGRRLKCLLQNNETFTQIVFFRKLFGKISFALHEETFRSSFMLLIAVVSGRWLSKNCSRDFKERFPQDGCPI